MPALLPILAIFAVWLFISTHAATTQQKPKSKTSAPSSDDVAKALETIVKASAKPDK